MTCMTAFVTGVRQIKIWVIDLTRSRRWYGEVFELQHVLSFEDHDGVIRGLAFRVPGATFDLALREDPKLAGVLVGADPFVLATTRESLDAWVDRLDSLHIDHTGIHQASRGYSVGFRDPDGLQIWLHADDPELAAKVGPVVRARDSGGVQGKPAQG